MGVGLHGKNGLDAATLLKLIEVYVLPRLLYGLDSIVLPKKHINKLELFFRRILRQIQGLPDTVANVAVYLLLNTIPVEALLHKRVLSLFGNITRLECNHLLLVLVLVL